MKFLIIQTSFIGDVILASSIVEKLHQYYPTSQIDFLLRKGNESLFEGHPFLGKVYVWDKKRKYASLWEIFWQIRKQKYDVLINLQRFFNTGWLSAFSGAKMRLGFQKNPFSIFFSRSFRHEYRPNWHEIDRNHQLISQLSDATAAPPRLYPRSSDFEFIQKYQHQNYICIAPSSVWFTKAFPVRKWKDFVEQTKFEGKIYLLGAKNDSAICEEIAQKNVRCEVLAGKLSLLQSAALMQKAVMNFVNDSSPLHLANAMNAPVTAIFCSTTKDFGFYPLTQKSFIVENTTPLACRPCGLHGKSACPLGHFACAEGIKLQDLWNKIE